jgi:prepilin-type N-terminal cleavage/methylation domain-containing protein
MRAFTDGSSVCSTGFQPAPSSAAWQTGQGVKIRATASLRRAFTLTELLFTLALMGIAAVLSTRLFTGSIRVIHSAPQTQNHYAAIDRISASLRQDIWGASNIENPDAQTIVLIQPDRSQIKWTFDGDSVKRIASDHEHRWPMLTPLSVARDAAQVIVKTQSGDQLRFTSQLLAMNGARP